MHRRSRAEVVSVLDDLRRIVAILRKSSRAAEAKLGVSGAQLFVLQTLAGRASLSMNQLAARTRTHQSTVSVVVKRLVEARLVARAVARDDARKVALSLTPRGRALIKRAPGAAQEQLIDGIERLSGDQRAALATALRQLVRAMHAGDAQPDMFFEEDERK